MKIQCIAVDDEPPALVQMEDYIGRVPFLNLMGTFDNAISTLDFLKNNQLDLVFLDIEMEDFTGIQLLGVIKNRPKVILTTAYGAYALKAYELDVADYLLKPISFERFLQAVEKVYDNLILKAHSNQGNTLTMAQEERNYFFVKTEYRMQRVDFRDILYVEGMKEYLNIHTLHERIITLMSFKRMEEILPDGNFVRVHKSFIVALDKIKSIERNRIRINDQLIPIGEIYSKVFFSTLENRKLV